MKIITFLIMIIGSATFAISSDEIVKKADEYRAPGNVFEMEIELKSYKNGKLDDESKLRGYIDVDKGSMIKFLKPRRSKGRKILMLGDNMWIFFPRTRKPVRITPAQKLMGEVSNGDVANTRYSGDYSSEIISKEKLDGRECYKLKLIAKGRGKTYRKIIYWIEQKSYQPVKAEYFSLSGKHLKTAYFKDLKKFEGKELISKLYIYDAIKKDFYSIISYNEMKKTNIPDKYFNKSYLKRMR